jgi:large subunit ribosomal protein L31
LQLVILVNKRKTFDEITPDVYNSTLIMKKQLHPKNYRTVVFKDLNNDVMFLTRSTVASDETIKWDDGNEYPLITVHISSASHPFFTGQEKMIDIEGRVDRFKSRQDAAAKRKAAVISKANKVRVRKNADTVENPKKAAAAVPKAK